MYIVSSIELSIDIYGSAVRFTWCHFKLITLQLLTWVKIIWWCCITPTQCKLAYSYVQVSVVFHKFIIKLFGTCNLIYLPVNIWKDRNVICSTNYRMSDTYKWVDSGSQSVNKNKKVTWNAFHKHSFTLKCC